MPFLFFAEIAFHFLFVKKYKLNPLLKPWIGNVLTHLSLTLTLTYLFYRATTMCQIKLSTELAK